MNEWFTKTLLLAGIGSCLATHSLEALLTSTKAIGMGLVGVAYPQDANVGAINPAGITAIGDRFDIGGQMVHTTGKATIEGNLFPVPTNGTFDGTRVRNFWNPNFGIVKDLCHDISVGLVVYNQGHLYTAYGEPFILLGTQNLRLDVTQEVIAPMIAYQWNNCGRFGISHSFGISLDVVVQRMKLKGFENFDNALYSSSPGNVSNRGRDTSAGVGFTLGWRGQITQRLSLGLAWKPKTSMSKFKKYRGFLAEHGTLDIPMTLTGGFAFGVIEGVNVAFDVQYVEWDRIRSLHNKLLPNFVEAKLGTKNGAGFGWRNQVYYRVGTDWEINDQWTVRAGYRFARTPVPRSETAANLATLETSEQVATCGASYRFCWGGELSACYAHSFKKTVKGKNSIPDFLFLGEANLQQEIDVVGISYGQYF